MDRETRVAWMYLRVEPEGDRVAAVSFEGTGCTLSQAAASILAQQVNRKKPTLEEIAELSYEQVLDELGRDITMHRPRCATLALGTLKAAVAKLAMNRRLKAVGRSDEEIRALRAGL